jgi:hypothetical protein
VTSHTFKCSVKRRKDHQLYLGDEEEKAMGQLQARVAARGFMKIPGVHYDWKTIAAPLTNKMTMWIILMPMIMAIWLGELLDVKGAFLHGDFGPKEAPVSHEDPTRI